MNKLLIIIILIFCLSIAVSGEENLRIATSIFPIYDITKNIATDKSDIIFVVPIGANPHTFEPTPSTIKQLRNIDVFIGVHPEFDGWIEKFLSKKTSISYLAEFEQDKPKNPHIWLTVRGAMGLSEKIAKILSKFDSQNTQIYEDNLNVYQEKLLELDRQIADMFEGIENKKFIQWHPAWDYFAEDYGLEVVATIQKGHGDEPSVKEFMNITRKAKQENTKVIIVGLNVKSKSIETLIKEINGKEVRLDSIGNPKSEEKSSYINLMKHNARLLSESLK